MRKALTEALKYLPAELRKTLTYDRGREMAEHKILEEDLGMMYISVTHIHPGKRHMRKYEWFN